MLYMVTFTINIPPMLAYIPYMDPMGYGNFPSYDDFPSQAEQRRVLEELRLHKAPSRESRIAKLGRGCHRITGSCPQESQDISLRER